MNGESRPWTVGDLLESLSNVKPHVRIKLYSDAEGNEIRDMLFLEVGKDTVYFVPFD
jgi:hypothetical protein